MMLTLVTLLIIMLLMTNFCVRYLEDVCSMNVYGVYSYKTLLFIHSSNLYVTVVVKHHSSSHGQKGCFKTN